MLGTHNKMWTVHPSDWTAIGAAASHERIYPVIFILRLFSHSRKISSIHFLLRSSRGSFELLISHKQCRQCTLAHSQPVSLSLSLSFSFLSPSLILPITLYLCELTRTSVSLNVNLITTYRFSSNLEDLSLQLTRPVFWHKNNSKRQSASLK